MPLNYTNRPKDDFRGKTIAFCLPGAMYSGTFMTQMIRLLFDLNQLGVNFYISQKYSSMVNFARTDCLNADNYAGTMLTPWRGEIPYDYIMWIDSDQVFKVEDFINLLKFDKDIISGLYLMDGGRMYATVQDWDIEYFQKNGSFKFITPEYLKQWKKNNNP